MVMILYLDCYKLYVMLSKPFIVWNIINHQTIKRYIVHSLDSRLLMQTLKGK
jgi:hypothetical protein